VPVVAAALRLGVPFRAAELTLPIESPQIDALLEKAGSFDGVPLVALGRLRAARERSRPASDTGGDSEDDELLGALLGWSVGATSLDALASAVAATRLRLAALRRDDAALTLATAHGTKGLEFDHVAVIGLDDGRFPSARSVAESLEPERAMEEERRLAYVAWTRARRSLTLVYDPGAPSRFLLEAFEPAELGVVEMAA
jgi:superfamily I DNA/RNA helicase